MKNLYFPNPLRSSRGQDIRQDWVQFWTISHGLNRLAELKRLALWAKRKRLPGPLRLYERRLQEEESRLAHHSIQYPHLVAWARLLHAVSRLINPVPRYPARGFAAKYQHSRIRRNTDKT